MEKQQIKEALSEVLFEHRSLDPEVHMSHHVYVEELIRRRKRKEELREKIKSHVLGWSIISAVTGLGFLLWEGIKTWVKNNGNGT